MPTENFLETMSDFVAKGEWNEVESFFNCSELAEHLGIYVSLADPDLPRCEVAEVQPFHLGGIGQMYVNGVIISGILDLALGLTALKYAELGSFATSSLNIDIARPIENGRFYVEAKRNRKIGNKIFSEATIFNSKDQPCVYATGAVRVAIKP